MRKQTTYEKLIQYILENQERFYRVAYGYTGNQEDALDSVQSAVCKALEAHETIRNGEAVRTWFYRILVNECLAILKKRKQVVLCPDDPAPDVAYYEKAYEPDGEAVQELDNLEPCTQQIIRLRFFEELSLKEIAQITGLNLSTVKTKLYRGLKLLRETMEE